MAVFPDLETGLRQCAELYDREVPFVRDLDERILARIALTPREDRARPTVRRELVLSALVAAFVLGLAILVTVGVRSGLLQQPVHPRPTPTASAPAISGSFVYLSSTAFVSAQVGWLNETRASAGGPSVVFKTTDGGQHWKQQLRWDGPNAQQMLFQGNDGIVVGVGGVPLFRTSDGGAHWQRMALPSDVVPAGGGSAPIWFKNPHEGWLLALLQQTAPGPNCAPGGCPQGGVFYTADAGGHWTQIGKFSPMEAFPNEHMQGDMQFRDELNGWVYWASGSVNGAASSPIHLYATHDGGNSWKRIGLQPPQLAANEDVHVSQLPLFFNTRQGVLVVQSTVRCLPPQCQPAPAAARLYLYTTSDGGDHWSAPTTLPTIGGYGYKEVFFLDAGHYWIVAGQTVATSSDGGRQWTIYRNVVPNTVFLDQPMFVSATGGWAIGSTQKTANVPPQSVLYRTTDGGAHWLVVTTPGADLVQ